MVWDILKENMEVVFKKFKLDENIYQHQLKAYQVAWFLDFHYVPPTFGLEKLFQIFLNNDVDPSGKY
jgi:hypothetical protein